jgi:hypothetical protein
MECVERKPLVRPVGEQLDEFAAADEILCPERENLRHSVTGEQAPKIVPTLFTVRRPETATRSFCRPR